MTHLNSSSEFVHYPDAHLCRYSTNLLTGGHFQYSNCNWHIYRPRSVLRRWTKHHQGSQDSLQICSWTTGTSLTVFPCKLARVYAWSEFCMNEADDPSLRFFATMHVKDQVSGNVLVILPAEYLTASKLSGHLAVNFQQNVGFSAFLLRLFTDRVAFNFTTQCGFSGHKLVKLNFLWNFFLYSF